MKKSITLFQWSAKIISILGILVVSLFALDSFDQRFTFMQQLVAFAIHLIPSFILTIVLIIAWKWPRWGGIIYVALGTVLSIPIFILNYKMNHSILFSIEVLLIITFPFIISGVCFLISDNYKRKLTKES